MTPPRVLVFAYSEVGYACLAALLEKKVSVTALITHADNPNETLWFPSVQDLAKKNNIPVFLDPDFKSHLELEKIKSLKPDLIFSFYFRNLIPDSILKIPKLGAFNMHGSYLPYYRGRAPVNWAIVNGETKTGATLHHMVAKADAGDIVDQEEVAIGPDDSALEVQTNVTNAAVRILSRQIRNLLAGQAPRKPQDLALGRTFGRRTPEDGRLDWAQPAQKLHNLVRAVTHPFPGAFGNICGVKTFVWKTRLSNQIPHQKKPGDLVFEKGQLLLACGDNKFLEILKIQTDGQDEKDGAEWARFNLLERPST